MYIEANSVLDYTPAKAFKSGTLRIPETQQNFKVLGNVWDRRSLINQVYNNVIYEVNNIKYLGELHLIGVPREGLLEAQFISSAVNLNFGDKKLRDLDYSEWNHELNYGVILESQANEAPYIYDVINRGQFEDPDKLHVNERLPAIRIRSLLDKALEGWNLVGGILDDIVNLFEIYTESRNIFNDDDWENDAPFKATLQASQNTQEGGVGSVGDWTVTRRFNVSQNELEYGEDFNLAQNHLEISASGAYRFTGKIKGQTTLQFDSTDPNALIKYDVFIEIVDTDDKVYWQKYFDVRETHSPVQDPFLYDVDIETGYIRIEEGKELFVQVRTLVGLQQSSLDNYSMLILISSGSWWQGRVSRWFATGDTVEFEKLVPNQTINDFITQFCSDFGQQIYVNPATKTVYFRGFAHRKTNKFITDKVQDIRYSIPERINYTVKLIRDDDDQANRKAPESEIMHRDIISNALSEEIINLGYSRSYDSRCLFKPLKDERLLTMVDDREDDEIPYRTDFERRIIFFLNMTTDQEYDMCFGNIGGLPDIETFSGVPNWSMVRGAVDLRPEGMHTRYHKAGIDVLRADRVEAEIFYDTKDFLGFLYPTDDVGLQIQKIINRGTDSFYLKIETIESNGIFSKVTGFRIP